MIATHPALRLLGKLKFRGFWRTQLRRVRTPKGALFALLGLGVMSLWFGALLVGQLIEPPESARQASSEPMTALFMLAFVGVTVFGSLSYRGLYIPEEEIDLLLSAPVSRGDVVRYRMLTGFVRTAFGGAVAALFAAGRSPHFVYGFFGVWLYVVTLPVLGQLLSLLAGGTETRLGRLVERLPKKVFGFVTVALVALLVGALVSGDFAGRIAPALGFSTEDGSTLTAAPWIGTLLLAVKPWTGIVHATSFADFALWTGCALCVWVLLFELSARLSVDFRELSLSTSADVAKKIARRRRGGGASSDRVWSTAVGWRIPWIFGRGPFGAIAWRKSSSIVRKAGGTLLLSSIVVAVLTFGIDAGASTRTLEGLMTSSLLLVVLGSLYLTTGLRFDFREDLERMDVIRAWPLAPWKVFAATLLPEVLLVTGLLCLAILARGLLHQNLHPLLVTIPPAVGCFVFMWLALDNALFLFMPVRYVPGQDGGLQHTGRAMLMLFARMLLLGFAALGAALPVMLALLARAHFAIGDAWIWAFALGGATAVLSVESVFAVWLGGRVLARFDVARDRG